MSSSRQYTKKILSISAHSHSFNISLELRSHPPLNIICNRYYQIKRDTSSSRHYSLRLPVLFVYPTINKLSSLVVYSASLPACTGSLHHQMWKLCENWPSIECQTFPCMKVSVSLDGKKWGAQTFKRYRNLSYLTHHESIIDCRIYRKACSCWKSSSTRLHMR